MSLKKQIISENGAVALYHRIGNIKKNYDYIEITVNAYAKEAYRDKEKELAELLVERKKLIDDSYILTAKGEATQEEAAEINNIEVKMARMQELSIQHSFSLFQTTVKLDVSHSDEISFQEIYSRLKTETELFRDAEDC